MAITYYQANKILDRAFGSSTWDANATLYVGLSTNAISSDGTGAVEPLSALGYSRVAVTNDKTSWGSASSASLKNSIQITFPESSSAWGAITYVFIADALTSGNILYYDSLGTARTVAANTTVYFGVNNMTLSMTN